MTDYLFKDVVDTSVKLIMLAREVGIKAGILNLKEVDELIATCGKKCMNEYRTMQLKDLMVGFLMIASAKDEEMEEKGWVLNYE